MGRTAHCGLGPPTLVVNQDKPCKNPVQAFLIEVPSLQMSLTCVKLTNTLRESIWKPRDIFEKQRVSSRVSRGRKDPCMWSGFEKFPNLGEDMVKPAGVSQSQSTKIFSEVYESPIVMQTRQGSNCNNGEKCWPTHTEPMVDTWSAAHQDTHRSEKNRMKCWQSWMNELCTRGLERTCAPANLLGLQGILVL